MHRRRRQAVGNNRPVAPDCFQQRPGQGLRQVQAGLVLQLFYHKVHGVTVPAAGEAGIKRRRARKTAGTFGSGNRRPAATGACPRRRQRQFGAAGPAEPVRGRLNRRAAKNAQASGKHAGFCEKVVSPDKLPVLTRLVLTVTYSSMPIDETKLEAAPFTAPRHDWSLDEILTLYRQPLNDLLHRAHSVQPPRFRPQPDTVEHPGQYQERRLS